MRLKLALQGRRGDEDLAELGQGVAEESLARFIEGKAEVVDGEEGFFSHVLSEAIPFCKSQSACRCFLLPFAGKGAPLFAVDPKGEIVAVGTGESEAEELFFGAVFLELLQIVWGCREVEAELVRFAFLGEEAAFFC